MLPKINKCKMICHVMVLLAVCCPILSLALSEEDIQNYDFHPGHSVLLSMGVMSLKTEAWGAALVDYVSLTHWPIVTTLRYTNHIPLWESWNVRLGTASRFFYEPIEKSPLSMGMAFQFPSLYTGLECLFSAQRLGISMEYSALWFPNLRYNKDGASIRYASLPDMVDVKAHWDYLYTKNVLLSLSVGSHRVWQLCDQECQRERKLFVLKRTGYFLEGGWMWQLGGM